MSPDPERRLGNGLTTLAVTAMVAIAAAGCGSSSHKASTSRTAPSTTARAATRIAVPALVVRARGQVLAFVKLTVKGHPYLFLVDTGATTTQVDSSVAKALALAHRGPAHSITSVCKVATQPVAISNWMLGGEALPATTVDATKTQFSGVKFKGVPFGGSLGSDVLSRFETMTLDALGRRLILGGAPPSGGRSFSVKVTRISDGEVLVTTPATIHGKPALYVIDTGSGRTTINSLGVKALGHPAEGKSLRTHTAFCSAETFTPVRINGWMAGEVKLPSVFAISKQSSSTSKKAKTAGGLLGLDVLSRFGEVTIDFAGQRVVLGGTAG